MNPAPEMHVTWNLSTSYNTKFLSFSCDLCLTELLAFMWGLGLRGTL